MKQIRREDCSVLSLVLKGKWYDMIASGRKREEYRDESEYWRVRIDNWHDQHGLPVVEFRRGYGKDAPRMWFTVGEVFFRQRAHSFTWGEPIWPHFAISLKERVELMRDAEGGSL